MKTAIQILIDEITSYLDVHESPEAREVLRILKASAIRKYWREEKEQIVEAFYQGIERESDEHGRQRLLKDSAEQYYNETFNTKEK